MTPPDEPPSNPYDPNWPKPEHPAPTQPMGQEPAGPAPYAPYGQQQPYGHAPGPDPSQAQVPWGQPATPYAQVPYGQPGQVPYGAPSYGGGMLTQHPSATTAMVLGICALGGMFVCGLPIVLSPFAWMVGGRAVREIDANPGRYSGRDQAQAGRIMGMIGSALLVLIVIGIVAVITLAVTVSESTDVTYDPNTGYNTNSSF